MARIGRPGTYLYEVVESMIQNNIEYFKDDKTPTGEKFLEHFSVMQNTLLWLESCSQKLLGSVHHFDLDPQTPGNGYRSFITIVDRFIMACIKLCRAICIKRDSIFFRTEMYLKELEAHVSVLCGLRTGMTFLQKMLESGEMGNLFSVESMSVRELLDEYGTMDQTGFYGRCLGFYYCESMRRTLVGVSVVMASFSDQYRQSGGAVAHAAASLYNCGKYTFDPERRAKHIVEVTQNASLEFLKAFWSLNEGDLVKKVPAWLCPTPTMSMYINIPLEQFQLPTDGGKEIDVPLPCSHIPPAPVSCRFLSYVFREGQEALFPEGSKIPLQKSPPSPGLLIHCHGGGFVAQTPESHEIYLRDWAKDLNVPVLSINYSLAPEAPYPRAIEEILYVYAWSLVNHHKLGWTGEHVCVAGDSAGGNLVLALCLKTIELNIRRPDGIFCAYTPVMLNMVPSPSRLLCAMDALLPLGFMLTCLHAYAGIQRVEAEWSKDHSGHSTRNSVSKEGNLMEGTNQDKCSEPSSPTGISHMSPSQSNGVLHKPVTRAPGHPSLISDISHNRITGKHILNEDSAHINHISSNCVSSAEKPQTEKTPLKDAGHEANLANQQYLAAYLKKCKIEESLTEADAEFENPDEHVIFELPMDVSYNLRQKCCQTTKKCFKEVSSAVSRNRFYQNHIAGGLRLFRNSKETKRLGITIPWYHRSQSKLDTKFETMKVLTSDPFISPYLASDDMLKKMPPAYFLCLHLDPTLDDLVMLAKKIRGVGGQVKLEILDSLPHGFLNFLPFSKEAHEGSQVCVRLMKEALKMETTNRSRETT